MKSIFKYSIFLMILSNSLFAGIGGAHFLLIGGSAKTLGMANATQAQMLGVESIYWNPAGITSVNRIMLNISYSEMWADMKYQNIAIATPIFGGVLGLSLTSLDVGEIEITTEDDPGGTGEFYDAYDVAFGVTYARNVTDQFSAGVTFKYINQTISDVSAGGIAFDASGIFKMKRWMNMRIAFGATNFGPDMSFSGDGLEFTSAPSSSVNENQREDQTTSYISETFTLPLNFTMGIAIDPIDLPDHRVTVEFDAIKPVYLSEPTYRAGLEYTLIGMVSFRGGITPDLDRGFTLGGGVKSARENASFAVDYSFETHEYLDSLHKFSLTLGF
jgi:hypothetical protein